MSTPPRYFPSVLDSTILAAWRSCQHRARVEFFNHWRPQMPNVHLHAGAAYATGQEAVRLAYFRDGLDPETSLAKGIQALTEAYGDFECPNDSAKSLIRMAGALEFYYHSYPLGVDQAVPVTLPGGKLGVEFSFSEPLPIAHPVTGDPLLYAGRLDMICSYNGLILGEDDKTASQLGASWPRQWDLRSQFTGYTWGAAQHGIKLDGFLVRGVSILKTKYDTLEAVTYRPQWQIDRWYKQLLRDVEDMLVAWRTGEFSYNLDHACTEYGGCIFRSACLHRQPQAILDQQFERRRWDPVQREELPVIEAECYDPEGLPCL